jgi:hypothetical protein
MRYAAPIWIFLAAALLSSCGERIYTLKFGGYECKIPRSYFPSYARPKGDESLSLIIDYYLPDFTSEPTRRLDAKYRGGHGDTINASLQPGVGNLLPLYAAEASLRPEGAAYSDAFGLRQVEVQHWAQKPTERNHLLLYGANDGLIKTLIVCDPNPRSPPCQHWFNAGGIDFRLTYSLRHLSQWSTIEAGSRAVLARLCHEN